MSGGLEQMIGPLFWRLVVEIATGGGNALSPIRPGAGDADQRSHVASDE